MKTKNLSTGPAGAVGDELDIDPAGLWLGVTDRNLQTKIKQVFVLARSAGRELDLTFSAGGPVPEALELLRLQRRHTAATLVLTLFVQPKA